MMTENAISAKNIVKSYKDFALDIPGLNIPKGFTTVVIGKNGSGKTTLLNILAALYQDYSGDVTYFDKLKMPHDNYEIKTSIGYQASQCYFASHWTQKDISKAMKASFDNFSEEKFNELCAEFELFGLKTDKKYKPIGRINTFSDGMKMKAMLAAVLARDTKLLILDEPASPLDPVMRDRLCGIIGDYIAEGNGEHSVILSTHNIADTEAISDYAVIIDSGKILEQGWTTELSEKYLIVTGDLPDYEKVSQNAVYCEKNSVGFTALLLSENVNYLSGTDVSELPVTLSQLSVMLMKSAENRKGSESNEQKL
ncbi:MAG: ABC transporter ATP-binding protein [Oscillospiraceae bacterium]|nr:ABC transporter ATP-binding protein [Oscillospiraceae bacterium]